jgi:secondary thiamine-phosphate synthase enzyme
MFEIRVKTSHRVEAKDITSELTRSAKGKEGKLLHLYTPHTTCGLLINENADPNVMRDIMDELNRMVPDNYPYKHREGNADAHIKSSFMGCSAIIPLNSGSIELGTWQGVFLIEFDGPRERRVIVNIV